LRELPACNRLYEDGPSYSFFHGGRLEVRYKGPTRHELPFEGSVALDEHVRILIAAMLDPVEVEEKAELLSQVPYATVVGSHNFSCLLEVNPLAPRTASIRQKVPVVVALVDVDPEDADYFNEPYVGELELFVQEGLLHALIYSTWYPLTELPRPDQIHPTSEVTSHAVLRRGDLVKGKALSSGSSPLTRG
jgi:hypothetical protein